MTGFHLSSTFCQRELAQKKKKSHPHFKKSTQITKSRCESQFSPTVGFFFSVFKTAMDYGTKDKQCRPLFLMQECSLM